MEGRDKIARFISYHNIIRPIGYPLLAWPFFSGLFLLFYFLGYFFSPNPHLIERVVCITGILLSICGFTFGLKLRKKYLNLFDAEPGESLYSAEVWKYICFTSQSVFMLFYWLLLYKNNRGAFMISGVIFLVTVALVPATTMVIKIRIKKDIYNGKKNIDNRIIVFFASGTFIAIAMIIKNIVLRVAKANGPFIIFFIGFIAAEVSTILAVIYYLKLKYAKEYGLEEYLPERPHPSPYTDWE